MLGKPKHDPRFPFKPKDDIHESSEILQSARRRWRRGLMVGSATILLVMLAVIVAIFVRLKQFRETVGPVVAEEDTVEALANVDPAALDELLPADPWWVAQLPVAHWFISPMGTRGGGLIYNAQLFNHPNIERNGRHTGEDYNGIGQENSDLGDPVYAASRGGVLFAADVGGGWGGMVILLHRLDDGELVQTLYAHLDSIYVVSGATVASGERIGSVGNAGGRYFAHLHFEVRKGARPYLGKGYLPFDSDSNHGRLDAAEFLRQHAPPFSDARFFIDPLSLPDERGELKIRKGES